MVDGPTPGDAAGDDVDRADAEGSAGAARPPLGARFRGRIGRPARPERPERNAAPEPPRPGHRFDSVVRGYDRSQVDQHVDRQDAEMTQLRDELEAAERQRRALEEYVAALEAERREREPRDAGTDAHGRLTGHGPVADRLLRVARHEAATVRATAARESAELLERARAEAEAQRRRADEAVADWVAVIHQDMSERMAKLEEEERAVHAALGKAREEAREEAPSSTSSAQTSTPRSTD